MNNISEDELDQQKEVSTSIVSKVLAKVPKHFPSIVDNPLYQVSTKLSSVLAIPGRVVFSGFHIMKLRTAKVRIVNKGSTRIRIQLADIPSHGFTITQKKAVRYFLSC